MVENRKMLQMSLETRKIKAVICDEGGNEIAKIPVFAWALYSDDTIEPLFIHKDYMVGGLPYGIDTIEKLCGKGSGVTNYVIVQD